MVLRVIFRVGGKWSMRGRDIPPSDNHNESRQFRQTEFFDKITYLFYLQMKIEHF
jgi:hypothetical protein